MRVAVRFRLPPRTEFNLEAGFGGIKWDKWDSAAQVAALRHATLVRVAGYRPCRGLFARALHGAMLALMAGAVHRTMVRGVSPISGSVSV